MGQQVKSIFIVCSLAFILGACFDTARGEPLPIKASQNRVERYLKITMPAKGDIAEGDLVMSARHQVPHDLVDLKIPLINFMFRVVEADGTFTDWQDSTALTAKAVRGKIIQLAVAAAEYGNITSFSLGLLTHFDHFFAAKVRSRKQWGARPAKPDMDSDTWKHFFAVHHSAGQAKSDDTTVKGIQVYHMDTKNWSDVGYHFLIGPDGRVFEGRELPFVGAHVYRHNKESIGINFLGCYDSSECHFPKYPEVSEVNDKMIEAMGELIGALSVHYGIDINELNVRGHKEFSGAATACPGDRVMSRMSDIRSIARLKSQEIKASLE